MDVTKIMSKFTNIEIAILNKLHRVFTVEDLNKITTQTIETTSPYWDVLKNYLTILKHYGVMPEPNSYGGYSTYKLTELTKYAKWVVDNIPDNWPNDEVSQQGSFKGEAVDFRKIENPIKAEMNDYVVDASESGSQQIYRSGGAEILAWDEDDATEKAEDSFYDWGGEMDDDDYGDWYGDGIEVDGVNLQISEGKIKTSSIIREVLNKVISNKLKLNESTSKMNPELKVDDIIRVIDVDGEHGRMPERFGIYRVVKVGKTYPLLAMRNRGYDNEYYDIEPYPNSSVQFSELDGKSLYRGDTWIYGDIPMANKVDRKTISESKLKINPELELGDKIRVISVDRDVESKSIKYNIPPPELKPDLYVSYAVVDKESNGSESKYPFRYTLVPEDELEQYERYSVLQNNPLYQKKYTKLLFPWVHQWIYAKETQTINEHGADTSWTDDDDKVTLQDILELTKDIPIINYPTKELAKLPSLKKLVLGWNPEEIERISQVDVSRQYPILIMVNEYNEVQWILDGNHRAQQAVMNDIPTIPAKLIKPSDLDERSIKIFYPHGIPDKENLNKLEESLNEHKQSKFNPELMVGDEVTVVNVDKSYGTMNTPKHLKDYVVTGIKYRQPENWEGPEADTKYYVIVPIGGYSDEEATGRMLSGGGRITEEHLYSTDTWMLKKGFLRGEHLTEEAPEAFNEEKDSKIIIKDKSHKYDKKDYEDFIKYATKELNIEKAFTIYVEKEPTGDYSGGTYRYKGGSEVIRVRSKGRSFMDILRSIAHELVHHKQKEDGKFKDKEVGTDIPEVGGKIEDEANATAGRLIKKYGQENKNLYEHKTKFNPHLIEDAPEEYDTPGDSEKIYTIQDIVDRVYPHIVNNLGKSVYVDETPTVELWKDIYARVSGIEGMEGEESESSEAQYEDHVNTIFIYYPNMANAEDVIRALLHEYTHSLQDPDEKEENRKDGYELDPNEMAALEAESTWRDYLVYLKGELDEDLKNWSYDDNSIGVEKELDEYCPMGKPNKCKLVDYNNLPDMITDEVIEEQFSNEMTVADAIKRDIMKVLSMRFVVQPTEDSNIKDETGQSYDIIDTENPLEVVSIDTLIEPIIYMVNSGVAGGELTPQDTNLVISGVTDWLSLAMNQTVELPN